MNHATTALPQTSVSRFTWLQRAIAVSLALAALLYGLAAIDAGIVNFRGAGNAEIAAKRVAMQQAGEEGKSAGDFVEITEHSSVLVGVLSETTSPQYAYGKGGLSESLIHYATMPKANGIVISMHSMLAGTCMLFGALQFWPAFRKRYPKWHRSFGVVYMVAAQAAMIASTVYLIRTPIVDIYDQLTFYVGLWGLVVLVTMSLWMAIYSLWRKQIAQHQGWMCLNYGLLLTAPVQRYGWVAFGMAAPQLRQLEANYAVSGVLIPLTMMMGYGVFTINRWLQAVRPAAAVDQVAKAFAPISRFGRAFTLGCLLVLLAAVASTVQYFILTPSLGLAFHAQTLIPVGVLTLHDAVIADSVLTRLMFAAASVAGLLIGVWWLWAAFVSHKGDQKLQQRALWALVVCGAVVGPVLVHWGLQMGMPSFATLSGGALNVFGGCITLMFSMLLAFALRGEHQAWAKEWGIFVLTCLVATPSFYWQLPMLELSGIDANFIASGHIYRMAESGAWFIVLIGFAYGIYSKATHSRLAR